MKGFLSGFSRALGVFGMLLLGIVLVFDHRWAGAWVGVILVFSATVLLRTYQVPLTKYGALNFLAFPAIAGSIINGAPSTAFGLYAGVLVNADDAEAVAEEGLTATGTWRRSAPRTARWACDSGRPTA